MVRLNKAKFKYYLAQSGITQRAIARSLGIEESLLSRIIQAKVGANERLATRIARHIGVPLVAIVADDVAVTS